MALVTLSYLSIFSNDRIPLRGLSYFSDILSGKFMVRINPDLHKKIVFIAKKEGQSLNSLVEKSLCLYAK
ncbi:toxin-antitoxin system HicB family antitoxin [Nostoc sp.]|uniref:toxin-antitoxin system HicB family antitoxin n=1 Tax=Nostoc sp. TaxID=1180 RepID=UPI002FF8E9E8